MTTVDAGKGGSMGMVVLYVCEVCGAECSRDMANVESADADADAATRLQRLLTCECPACGGTLRAKGLTMLMPDFRVLFETLPKRSMTPTCPAGTTVIIWPKAMTARKSKTRRAGFEIRLSL